MTDPRKREECEYTLRHMIWTGLTLFLCQSSSLNAFDLLLRDVPEGETTAPLASGIGLLSGEPHRTTATTVSNLVKGVLSRLPHTELEALQAWMTKTIVRSRALDRFRLNGLYMVAVDGTEYLSFAQRHCAGCLERRDENGETVGYHHPVLVARLVTPTGLTLPMAVEFIENGDLDLSLPPDQRKQDCELKAFRRLAVRLKELFPLLPICIVGDALYANATVMEICTASRWSYILRFKEGCIPTLHRKAQQHVAEHPEDRRECSAAKRRPRRIAQWCEGLRHADRLCHVLFFEEHRKGALSFSATWLLSPDLRPAQIDPFETARFARLRWKIENETFNSLKNGGYHLGHVYSAEGESWKNLFHLCQMAHLFVELTRLGDMLGKLMKLPPRLAGKAFSLAFGSVAGFARRLTEAMRFSAAAALLPLLERALRMQYRFSSA